MTAPLRTISAGEIAADLIDILEIAIDSLTTRRIDRDTCNHACEIVMQRSRSFAAWRKENPEADLQVLAAKYGGSAMCRPKPVPSSTAREEWLIKYRERQAKQQ